MLLISIAVLALLIGTLVCACAGAFTLGTWVWLLPLTVLAAFVVLLGAGFAFLMYLCKRVDQDKEQEQDDKFYRIVANLIVESAFWVLRIRVKESGMEKVPRDGRFLLVCNHLHEIDPAVLLRAFGGVEKILFPAVVLASVLLSWTLARLSRREKMRWLRWLYQ